jgi:hypothetical protein
MTMKTRKKKYEYEKRPRLLDDAAGLSSPGHGHSPGSRLEVVARASRGRM